MKQYFNATYESNMVGDGTVAAMVTWLEKYVNVLFPDNGIEYFADNQGVHGRYLKRESPLPLAGLAEDCVHHVACYVRDGSCEGRIIEVGLFLRSYDFKSLTWIKTFGSADESWEIARAIDAALNSIIFWHAIPEMVMMSEKVPRQYPWYRATNLKEKVTVLSCMDKVRISTESGLVLEDRSWTNQGSCPGPGVEAVTNDWVTVLSNMKVSFTFVKVDVDQLIVPELPGYVISKRGCEVPGFYVLPPGGNESDDRTYLGYFNDADAAFAAAKNHKSRLEQMVS